MKNKLIKKIAALALITPLIFGCQTAGDASEASLLEEIKEKGEITIATEGTYAPFSYHDSNNKLVGYDIEVAEAVAKKLGVKPVFVETKWDGIIAGLDAKKYDTIANQVGITEERLEKYNFSNPYIFSYASVVTRQDNNDISSFDDLKGKKSAQTANSNWAEIVRKYDGEVVGTEGFNQSLELVLQGRVDATVNDNVSFLDYLIQQPDANIKIAAQSDEVNESAFLLRKEDSDELQTAINSALDELSQEGVLKKISLKYFGEDVSVKK